MAVRKEDFSSTGGKPRQFVVSMSPSGQITLPAPFRKAAVGRQIARFVIREVDAERGRYELAELPRLGELLASYAEDLGDLSQDWAELNGSDD